MPNLAVYQYPEQATEVRAQDFIGFDQQDPMTLGWTTKKVDLPTIVASIESLFPGIFDTIFTGGEQSADSLIDQDGNKISFINGNVNFGTTGITGGLFKIEVVSTNGGIIVASQTTGLNVSANAGTGVAVSGSNIGLSVACPRNVIQKSGSLPSAVPSSVFEVNSTDQGSRPVPRMTEGERDVITSPADYIEIVNTTRERKEFYHPFFGWHPVGSITPDWGYEFSDELIGTDPYFVNATSGGVNDNLTDSALSPLTLYGMSTGTSSSSYYRHLTRNYFLGSIGKKMFENRLSVNALSSLTDRYVVQVGYMSTNTGTGNSDGMYFLYDEGGVFGSATASPNWLCVCRNGGSYSIVDSDVAVTTISSPMQKLKILDYGTGDNVEFIINGTVVATIINNIPDSTKPMYIGERIVKTTGTTPRIVYVDYSYAKEKFNTPR